MNKVLFYYYYYHYYYNYYYYYIPKSVMYKAQLLLKVIFPWSAQAHGGDAHGSGKGCMLFTSHLLQDCIILQQRTIQKGSILLSHQLGCLLKDAKKKGKWDEFWRMNTPL